MKRNLIAFTALFLFLPPLRSHHTDANIFGDVQSDDVAVSGLEIFGGVKNLTNAFQDDFDTGRNRDSGYIYGPGAPRTNYPGLRLHSF